jgi:hypothetical protein
MSLCLQLPFHARLSFIALQFAGMPMALPSAPAFSALLFSRAVPTLVSQISRQQIKNRGENLHASTGTHDAVQNYAISTEPRHFAGIRILSLAPTRKPFGRGSLSKMSR